MVEIKKGEELEKAPTLSIWLLRLERWLHISNNRPDPQGATKHLGIPPESFKDAGAPSMKRQKTRAVTENFQKGITYSARAELSAELGPSVVEIR